MGQPTSGSTAPESIAVLDFGSQYTQLIVRRVRECHVYCRYFPHDVSKEELAAFAPAGIILSGGPSSVYDADAPQLPDYILSSGAPILGICYGMHEIAHLLGGQVTPSTRREYGPATLDALDSASLLFQGLAAPQQVWMSHGDYVTKLPPGFCSIAASANSPIAAMADPGRRIYALQFHPEVAHTTHGQEILRNFLYRICGCRGLWTAGSFISQTVAQIREQVGGQKAICALSGGVDSAVAAALVAHAIGSQLTCVFVDHGLLRLGEAERNMQVFGQYLDAPVILVNAKDRFLRVLAQVTEPEEKRKIIGEHFIRVFEETTTQLGEIAYLVQGTLYPDIIESAGAGRSKTAARIKTHHNVGGLPKDMTFKLIEPLKDLFKDEVREVGRELGLPDEVVNRQPFPGPGLAVRIIGEITQERLDTLRAADAIVTGEIEAAGLGREIWQYFAILTPLRSVGVMGDGRTYANVVGVRAVTSQDAMTADWARLPYDLLGKIANRIVNEVPGVNRVVYDITSKPPATIEWE
jgi:GMP synthase (glutamine-hydrolysing)